MKKIQFNFMGKSFSIRYGKVTTIQDVEKSISKAIVRLHKKDLPWNSSSWFQLNISTLYHFKQIRVIDFTSSFEKSVYENSEDSIEELLYKAKVYFDELK